MTDLIDELDRLAVRGTPRGAEAVFEAATQMSSHAPMAPTSFEVNAPSVDSSVGLIEFVERSTARTPRRKKAGVALALFAIAGVIAVAAVTRWQNAPHRAEPTTDQPSSSTPLPDERVVEVPALSSPVDSQPTTSATAFGSRVAGVLAAIGGTAPDLRETATRTTGQGQEVEYAYFAQTGRRLFVLSGGPGLVSSVPGLQEQLTAGPQTVAGAVLVWPETATKRTIALTLADSVLIVSSEAIDQTGTASALSELVDLATRLAAFDAFAALPLGRPDCSPPSPVIGNEFRGTSDTAQLSGLIFAAKSTMHAGDDVKLVVRMTGSGPLTITTIAPDGTSTPLDATPHTGSTFDRPGDEWDTSTTYAEAGCWQFHFARTDSTADVYFEVAA